MRAIDARWCHDTQPVMGVPPVQRSFLLIPACLLPLLISNAVRACPMPPPTYEAIVDSGLSSIRSPLHVGVYGDSADSCCHALLDLPLSTLPSRSLVPRPRELADELVPVMKAFGAKTCEVRVFAIDDRLPEEDRYDEEACRRGEFRYDGSSW